MSEEKSAMIEEDLEDGEIESDDDDVAAVSAQTANKTNEAGSSSSNKSKNENESPSPQRKSSDNKRSSKKSKSSSGANKSDEDDFMSSIESKIANVLKKEGVEPPMPNIQKKPEEKEPEPPKSRNRKRRRENRKDRKDQQQKRDGAKSKKRTKLSADSDNLYMVGGSPERQDQQNSASEDSDSYTSYSSYDSDDYRRSNYDDRRSKRRDKYSSRNERERDRDRDRDRNRKRRDHDSEKEEDCNRAHEVRQPKKMELCKFWLMECCAKKDKCSYMHGDFPCKYYYLGLKCINKDCKFMHGKPLSDNLKQILLKHLDTAPKEILGDFPRIGRENASKMLSQTHIKLCQEFNIPLPENEKTSTPKIPSLLEMKLKPPEEFSKNDNRMDSRNSRWLDPPPTLRNTSTSSSTAAATSSNGPGDTLLSEMRGILSDKQIESMAAIGVTTVNHINNLTVFQINDIGLSLGTIGEIQATAMNMHSMYERVKNEESKNNKMVNDVDLRNEPSADVDMRIFNDTVIKSPDTIMSPTQSDAETQEINSKNEPQQSLENQSNSTVNDRTLMSPPSSLGGIDYSQYLKDSNINDDENEDEPGLRIDETYASDYEAEDKKDSQSEDDQQEKNEASTSNTIQLLPPSFDTSAFLNTPALAKVDISSSIQQLMEKASPNNTDKASRDPRSRDPRMAAKSSPTKEKVIQEISSPDKNERRTSIYEIESPSEDEGVSAKIEKDKDMRMLPFMRDSVNGDLDFRFPFTPMANYVPATEIDASFGMHVFDKYEVKIVDIPKPDYSEIRRSFKQIDNTQDPRLKKLCGLLSEGDQSKSSTPSDPRKRKQDSSKDEHGPKRLQISTILQNSKHYNELSSSQKIIVNDVLSELSKQLKLFHSDPSPSKIFDTSFISLRPRLQQILIGLGVFVNAEGEFEEIKDMPLTTPPTQQVVNLPNIHQMPPTILPNIPNIMAQPPPNLMMQPPPNLIMGGAALRPGLLGMAPTAPLFSNFEPQDSFINNNNQGQAFGNDQNFNNRNSNQRQHNSNNNFRNNSHRNSNNNNYRSNRR
ncbi:hypothetical protein PVAND_005779 [Polypedilum vanderplanki]|uniref:C3H1-type domain-containing protein n=1 Tax=Polypedilum vanderplanki TaxID=319348 RepID=A0A9J6C148_POLVA|nr:hypothetical protein PVAND_005779 [Polypedilum vanderplanki]